MTWWKDDARDSIGWRPVDSADPFAGQLAGKVSGDPIEERYMGGDVLLARLLARHARAAETVRLRSGNAMPEGRLYIGNRRYSSWSMRGWLAVKLAELDVEEVMIHFSRPGPTEAIGKLSPNGLVPYLEHRGARVWESLAVCEYCAEIAPSLWPVDRIARAACARDQRRDTRRLSCGLRQSMWMNLGRDFSGLGRTPAGACRRRADRGDVGGDPATLWRGSGRSCSAPLTAAMSCTPRW